MRAVAFLPSIGIQQKNDLSTLLAASSCSLQIFDAKESLLADIRTRPADILIVQECAVALLDDIRPYARQTILLLNPDTRLQKLGPLVATHAQIHSFMTIDLLELDPRDVVTTFRKHLSEEIFGLELYLRNATTVREYRLTSTSHKNEVLDEVSRFVLSLDDFRAGGRLISYSLRIKELLDELVLNALFDANPRLRDAKRHDAHDLRPGEEVVVRWGFDGVVFAVSVSDPFGALDSSLALSYITKTIRLGDFTKRKSGGMGLQLIFDKAHQMIVNVEPNHRTEIICLLRFEKRMRDFDQRRKSFHFFVKNATKPMISQTSAKMGSASEN